MEPEAIFVVGVSRSGTTLMRNVLNSHSRLGIAPENHYLGHLLPGGGYRDAFRREGGLADDQTITQEPDGTDGLSPASIAAVVTERAASMM